MQKQSSAGAETGPTAWMTPSNRQLLVETVTLIRAKSNLLELGLSSKSTPETKRHQSSPQVKPAPQRKKTTVTKEVTKEIKLIKRNIWSMRPWTESFYVMRTMALHGTVSLVAALTAAAVYAYATPAGVEPINPEQQQPALANSTTFARACTPVLVTIYYVTVASFGYLFVLAFIFVKGPLILQQPTASAYATSILQAMRRLTKDTWPVLLLTLGLASVFTVLCCQVRLRIQVYGVSCIVQLVPAYASKRLHRLYKHRQAQDLSIVSIESQGSAPSSDYSTVVPLTPGPMRAEIVVLRFEFSLRDRLLPFVSLLIGVLYLHLSLDLDLTARWQRFAFVGGSLMLRVVLQACAKRLLLDTRMPPAIVISVVMVVPTVVIDVQIRLAFIRLGIGQSLLSISMALVFVEVFVRVSKILYLRRAVVKRLDECKSMRRLLDRVDSRISSQEIKKARQEYSQFVEWKKYMLRCHAAEVYADMYGEYIAIGCSTAVLQLLGRHSKFDLAAFLHIPMRDMLIIAGFQTGTGLLFDWLLSVVETLHEVPLHSALDDADSNVVRRFLRTLAAILAAVNVGLVALFAVELE